MSSNSVNTICISSMDCGSSKGDGVDGHLAVHC